MLFKNYDQLIKNGSTPQLQQKRKDALDMIAAAIEAVDPYLAVERVFQNTQLLLPSGSLDLSVYDDVYVVGFGKASVKMAQAVCDAVTVSKGVIVTNDPSATMRNSACVEVVVGGHPLPTEKSLQGAEKILRLLGEVKENDVVIILISGGGSALFCKPRVPLADLQTTTDLLLRSGATIQEFNTIRKHLSFVKGGQLAKHIAGMGVSLIVSDIVNDPISFIASGPTYPDATTFSDAKRILDRYELWERVPATVQSIITDGIAGRIAETLKENNPVFDRMHHVVIANNTLACQAAMQKAQTLGYTAKLMTTGLTGEARDIGPYLIAQAKQSLFNNNTAFIFGGESTVTVQGDGVGGRNQELVLSCVEVIAGTDMVVVSCATDGVDGNNKAAGALADGSTLRRAQTHNLAVSSFLTQNDSHRFFHLLGDILVSGPTGTNVMDVLVILP